MSAVDRLASFYDAKSRPPSLGRNFIAGIAIAALTALTQIILRRELAPGEFGTLNALLGIVLVLVVPLGAISFILRRALHGANLESLLPPLLNRAGLAWGLFCLIVLFIALPVLELPRTPLLFFTLLAVGAGLLAICGRPVTPARWCAVIGVAVAALRLVVSAWAGSAWPIAESGLAALILAALLAGLPALRDRPEGPSFALAWPALRAALVPGLATISVAFALVLFTNADRIAAQKQLGAADSNEILLFRERAPDAPVENVPLVNYRQFDDYQAAGLCARGLLWSLLPLLLMLSRQRGGLTRTTSASLHWFWIYLGALLAGAILLVAAAPLVDVIFTGSPAALLPGFAGAFIALGLIQAIAFFALASRRHAECFTLAACSLAYTGFLFYGGRQPQLLTSCMFGGALISLMLVLFVGVVRYARSHP